MQTADFDYELPPEFIAQQPVEPRDSSRLMVLDRAGGGIQHAHFHDLGQFLRAGDLLVLNDTRVLPGRLFGRKVRTGGRVELLLLKRAAPRTWEALVGGKGLGVGAAVQVEGAARLRATIIEAYDGARRLVQFSQPITPLLQRIGHVPLPPYIHSELADRNRYQTVFAMNPGSAAAPTAGLHFTPELMTALRAQGVEIEFVTLHVGLDTFVPVSEDNPQEHPMHGEWCEVAAVVADHINAARQEARRVIAVGTTCVRTLESAAQAAPAGLAVAPLLDTTHLYILPGFTFRAIDGLITNFHLPRSTLLMLVSAFAGRENILNAYDCAKREGYRFYSFGDAMLII
jgi:S-adenosylmethionine:tRNA ribosyltransferase-isomerase